MNTIRPATKADIDRERTREKREAAILKKAAKVFRKVDKLEQQLKVENMRLRMLCRSFDEVSGARGFTVPHLRHACDVRGFLAAEIERSS